MVTSNQKELTENYEEKIKKEAEFWGFHCRYRKGVYAEPEFFYDDPELEKILRGKYKRFIVEKATANPTHRVLELGCGEGWLSLEVATRGIQVDAYDLNPQLIELAKEQAKEFQKAALFQPPNFAVQDLNKIVLEPEKYDVVMIWDALHHILESERLLHEIHKGLKPGGELIMIDHVQKPINAGLRLAEFVKYLLPWDMGYRSRVKFFFRKIREKNCAPLYKPILQKEHWVESPFEDVTGIEMVQYISKIFRIKKKKSLLCYSHHLAARIKSPRFMQLAIVRSLKYADDILIGLHIFSGDYIFIHAVKK